MADGTGQRDGQRETEQFPPGPRGRAGQAGLVAGPGEAADVGNPGRKEEGP